MNIIDAQGRVYKIHFSINEKKNRCLTNDLTSLYLLDQAFIILK
jgi:hypothetical protein